MICRGLCLFALLGVDLVPARAADAASGQFDSLIKSSPFGQAGAGAQAGNGVVPLEFRGVFQDKGEYYFSLHEAASRTGSWVGLKETGQPYVVESYDPEKGAIQVKYRGQALTLSLKLAQVIVQAPPPIIQQAPGTTNITSGPAVIGAAASGDEAQRLAQVAEEIRRRRALRAPPGAGGPVPQPVPANNQPRPAVAPGRP